MIVVADTTPLNYLLLIAHVDLLPAMFGRVIIPLAVLGELKAPKAPKHVRQWIECPPSWLEVRPVQPSDPALASLDAGEQHAITLAEEIRAHKILLDETEARREASRRKLSVIGTLGILREGARRSLLDLPTALDALSRTSFHVSHEIIRSLLDEDAEWKKSKSGV